MAFMDIKEIRNKIEPDVEARGCFITDLTISSDNDITLAIESEEGTVVMEDCIALDKAFHEYFDQDVEDYSLTVTSAGLDQPFKVLRQYIKATGTEVEVRLKGGRKLTGELKAVSEEGITLKYIQKETVADKKKKVAVEHEDFFPFGEINSTMPHISFD